MAADARHRGRELADQDPRDHYLPIFQKTTDQLGVFVRTPGDPTAVANQVRRLLYEVDPEVPLFDVATMQQRMEREESEGRFHALLSGAFALIAVLLAMLGIYATLAYAVGERGYELSLRLALGATRRELLRLVGSEALAWLGGGLALGLLAAAFSTRALAGMLFEIAAHDRAVFAGSAGALAAVGLAASWLPVRRALRSEPATALRGT